MGVNAESITIASMRQNSFVRLFDWAVRRPFLITITAITTMLTLSAILCFLYLLKELYLWLGWLFAYRGTVQEEQQTDPIQLRQIERDGFVYMSPTQYEDIQNNTFEWGIKRFRVGGEGLEEDKTFGKTTALAHERSINHDKVLYILDDGNDPYNTNTNNTNDDIDN